VETLKKKFAGPEIFLRCEADLDFHKSRYRLKGRLCTEAKTQRLKEAILKNTKQKRFENGKKNLG
jgi:hypothetical protein